MGGAVRYRLTSDPLFTHCCYCLNCQRQTGSAFVINLLIEADRVELIALIDGATDLMQPFVATVAFTGARVSEVLGLSWADIDLDAGIIRIAGQLQRGERADTKTEAGVRGIGIPERLVTLLREHRRKQVERGVSVTEDAFVFASATDHRTCPQTRRRTARC